MFLVLACSCLLHLSDKHFNYLLRCHLYQRFDLVMLYIHVIYLHIMLRVTTPTLWQTHACRNADYDFDVFRKNAGIDQICIKSFSPNACNLFVFGSWAYPLNSNQFSHNASANLYDWDNYIRYDDWHNETCSNFDLHSFVYSPKRWIDKAVIAWHERIIASHCTVSYCNY